MDRAEHAAASYLSKTCKYIYEPNGKYTFPDFLLLCGTAVEVRMLNKNIFNQDSVEPCQTLRESLKRDLSSRLMIIPGDPSIGSFHVCGEYVPQVDKGAVAHLGQELEDWYCNPESTEEYSSSFGNLSLKCLKASQYLDYAFTLSILFNASVEGKSLGQVYKENVKLALHQKEEKARKSPHKYQDLWLILVDDIWHTAISSLVALSNQMESTEYTKVLVISFSGEHKITLIDR